MAYGFLTSCRRGHYGRALEDALSTNRNQWPAVWGGENPLRGERSFNSMTAVERVCTLPRCRGCFANALKLNLLRALVLWSLNQSDAIQAIMKESWKQTRRDDDKNQPRSVQPWFTDSYRRRFWLIEGQEDSHFRVYRENDGKTSKTNTWFSVAGSIDEVNALADKFTEENTQNAKINAAKLRGAIPRFEQGDDKRKRRDYRQQRKAAWTRPTPGFSLYEGRTRGKRARYTFDEDDDFISDGTRRSTRNASPVESGPVVTASGRQVKSRVGGVYGESLSSDQRQVHDYNSGVGEPEGEDSEDEMPTTIPNGRYQRAAKAKPNATKSPGRDEGDDGMDTDSDEKPDDGDEWSGNEDEPDEDDESEGEMSDDDDLGQGAISDDEGDAQKSLVVQLRYRPQKTPIPPSSRVRTPRASTPNDDNVEKSITNDFGGDATVDERPSQQLPSEPQISTSQGKVTLQNDYQPTTEQGMSDKQEVSGSLSTNGTTNLQQDSQPKTAVEQASEAANRTSHVTKPQLYPHLPPVINALKPLTPPSSLPQTGEEAARDLVAEGQQSLKPHAHPMDVS